MEFEEVIFQVIMELGKKYFKAIINVKRKEKIWFKVKINISVNGRRIQAKANIILLFGCFGHQKSHTT